MEGNNQKNSQYPYSFPPPTWLDPYEPSLSSSSVPNWVVAAIVIAVVILVLFVFWYIWRREQKIKEKAAKAEAAKAAAEKAKAAAEKAKADEAAKAAKQDPQKKDDKPKPKPPPTPAEQIYIPNTCQSCGHAAGIYSFAYLCPWCTYKAEIALAYPGPPGKK